MAEVIEQNAFVLHSRPYREHQLIVDLLTQEYGKVSAVVYSGKTNKSNKKGLLQPFGRLNVVLKGNNNLKNLSRIEASKKSFILKGEHLYSGFYLNELLIKLLGELIPCPDLFQQYQACLQALTSTQEIEPILREFELNLLAELGFSLDFAPVFEQDSEFFYFIAEQGFIPAVEKLNLPLYDKTHLEAIAEKVIATENILKTNKILIRQVFNHLLGGRPLNSRKLFIKNKQY